MSNDTTKRSQRKFVVQDELYGKLICSYEPEESFVDGLDLFFSDVLAEQREHGTVVNLNNVFICREEALRLLQENIARNFHDAMEGLIYEVRLQVLRSLNGWQFFVNHDATRDIREIRQFYVDCLNDRLNAHQGRGERREKFLREVIDAYAMAARKANEKATAAAKAHREKSVWKIRGKYGIRLIQFRGFDGKYEFFGKVTKAALAREMNLAGHAISQSVLSRQMKRYKIELSDLERAYDDDRLRRERA